MVLPCLLLLLRLRLRLLLRVLRRLLLRLRPAVAMAGPLVVLLALVLLQLLRPLRLLLQRPWHQPCPRRPRVSADCLMVCIQFSCFCVTFHASSCAAASAVAARREWGDRAPIASSGVAWPLRLLPPPAPAPAPPPAPNTLASTPPGPAGAECWSNNNRLAPSPIVMEPPCSCASACANMLAALGVAWSEAAPDRVVLGTRPVRMLLESAMEVRAVGTVDLRAFLWNDLRGPPYSEAHRHTHAQGLLV